MENAKTKVWFDGEVIHGVDLLDQWNGTVFFSQSKRGVKKAWEALEKAFTPDMSMYQAQTFLREAGIKCHQYCSID